MVAAEELMSFVTEPEMEEAASFAPVPPGIAQAGSAELSIHFKSNNSLTKLISTCAFCRLIACRGGPYNKGHVW